MRTVMAGVNVFVPRSPVPNGIGGAPSRSVPIA